MNTSALRLQTALERAARRPAVVAAAIALQLGSFRALRRIDERFARETGGLQVFDFQNRLTAPALADQLGAYTAKSARWYRRFFLMDAIFPSSASTVLAMLWARLLAGRPTALRRRLLAARAPLWPYWPTLWDWGENLCFLLVIERLPRRSLWLARCGIACKRLKLLSLAATFGGTALLIGESAVGWLIGGRSRQNH